MFSTASNIVLALATARAVLATSVSVTPHDSYSSSVGVLGCYIDTNRVAYWPQAVDCTNICVKLTNGDRSVNLLRIDQSGGAYDISYDAWAYLQTGETAAADPVAGGGVSMEYEEVDASECASLIFTEGNKLPLTAANSMDFVSSCLASDSWVGENYVLYNIADSLCSLGYDEVCTLDLTTSNQPTCEHTLGSQNSLTTTHVYNVEYPTGTCVDAATEEEVDCAIAYQQNGGESTSSTSSSAGTEEAPAAAAAGVSSSTSAAIVAPTTTSSSSTVAPAVPTTTSSSSTTAVTQTAPGVFVATSQSAGNRQQVSSESALSSSSSSASTSSTTTATITMTATLTSTVPCSTASSSSFSSTSVPAPAPSSSSSSSSETPILTTSQTTLTTMTSSSSSSSSTAEPTTTTTSKVTSTTLSTIRVAYTSTAKASSSAAAASTFSQSTLVVAPSSAPVVVGTGSGLPSASGSGATASPSTVVVSGASTGFATSGVAVALACGVAIMALL
ncbi:oligomeric mucus gel-forming [Sporothrix curviconia]|uniref:Oligomeric mucus gel-forming n=1 Tax=Sporothrix curviconia TaxID=1260050 RepID=A0ABP0CKA6_9PEZI